MVGIEAQLQDSFFDKLVDSPPNNTSDVLVHDVKVKIRHRYIGQFSLLTPEKPAASAFIAMVAPDLLNSVRASKHIENAKAEHQSCLKQKLHQLAQLLDDSEVADAAKQLLAVHPFSQDIADAFFGRLLHGDVLKLLPGESAGPSRTKAAVALSTDSPTLLRDEPAASTPSAVPPGPGAHKYWDAVSEFVRKQLAAIHVPDEHVEPVTRALLTNGITNPQLLRIALQTPRAAEQIEEELHKQQVSGALATCIMGQFAEG